jgi:Ser/Thr protein kinase RdoA (MazF antagonist)|tara:strand:- start:520 stop:1452 length:933 start_codon:yes stop_codon:yes gene_type:complete
MSKLKFNKEKLEKQIHKVFPKSKIKSFKEFKTGLVSPTFKVDIINPKKSLVIKLSKNKNKKKIDTNNKILTYLNKHNIPSPKIYLTGIFDKKIITIMEYLNGDVASSIYKKNKKARKNILLNAGKVLKKIHSLKIPAFWVHQHHEIKTEKEWKKWTRLRAEKYLKFCYKKLPKYNSFLEQELREFLEILEKEKKIKFVSLHWDYHLSNLNANSKGEIKGVFDFDNAMKGHNLADIGQTAYWIRFHTNDYKNFKYFLKGYKSKFSKKELKLIRGYFLLHILAVTRTIWHKQPRLTWIIKDHKKIIKEFKNK